GFAVVAVAGEIRNVVLAIELLGPTHHRVERAIHHQGRDVPLGQLQLFVRGVRMAEMQRHRAPPCGRWATGSSRRRWQCPAPKPTQLWNERRFGVLTWVTRHVGPRTRDGGDGGPGTVETVELSEHPENTAAEQLRQAIDEDMARIDLWTL